MCGPGSSQIVHGSGWGLSRIMRTFPFCAAAAARSMTWGMLGRVPAAISSRILARSSASITGSTTSRTRVPEVACPTRTSVEGGAALVQVRLVVVLAERPQKAQAPDAAAAGHSG